MAGEPARWCWLNGFDGSIIEPFDAPYAVGDRLWVGERVRFIEGTGSHNWDGAYQYKADGSVLYGKWFTADEWGEIDPQNLWRPSTRMPRWASRLTLTVTDVRVQRVQDISGEDAIAEGIEFKQAPGIASAKGWWNYQNDACHQRYHSDPRESFQSLWDSLNEKRGFGWDQNPWVAAYSFDVHRCNINNMAQGGAT